MEDFLDELRRKQNYSVVKTSYIEPFFCIDVNSTGAYVKVVNNKMVEIDVDYMDYNGEVFNTLRAINNIRTQKQFVINWEGTENKIYLHEHDYLIYLLMRCPNLININGEPFCIEKEPATLILRIIEKNEMCFSHFLLVHNLQKTDIFHFLTDSFVLIENSIYSIEPIGNSYKQASIFATSFPTARLETFLSILFSNLRHIEVEYNGYRVKQSAHTVSTIPVLIFEKIDPDKCLFMRVSKKLPNIEHEFIEQFELTVCAYVNDMERTISLRSIVQEPVTPLIEKLYKQIHKYALYMELQKDVYLENNLFIISEEVATNFIVKELPELLKTYTIYGAERLKEYKIRQFMPKIDLNFASNINFLEQGLMLKFDEQKISLFEALEQYKTNNYILLSDGTRAIVNPGFIQHIERVFIKDYRERKKLSFFDLPLVEDILEMSMLGSVFINQRKIYEGFNTISASHLELPPITAKLRDYQVKGVKWINYLYENKLGGCLADDMGLGKTLQAITMLAKIYQQPLGSSIIIMPKSLLYNWKSEIKKFAPQLSVYLYYGSERNVKEALNAQIILTTYGILRADIKEFKDTTFHYAILDESQNIKNRNSNTTKAVLLLKAEHRLALSGTPIENNLTELYSLFRFLNPLMFGSYDDFNRYYLSPIQRTNDKEAIFALRKKIYPFIMRRLKKDVLSELPDRMEQTLYVEMTEEQNYLYEMRRKYYYDHIKDRLNTEGLRNSQFVIFQALNELRRIASIPESITDHTIHSPKIEMLIEYVRNAIANDHKIIIFFNYIAGVELVSEKLNDENIDFVTITGSTKDRQKIIDRFQKDTACKVFLLTLKTGGVGLNLTAADTVFIFEPWWNRAAEEQAISRIHRIGQVKKVFSYSIITRGTIEEKIQKLQEKKESLFASLIKKDISSVKNLTEVDIDYILG